MIVLFLRENLFRAHDFAWLKAGGGMFSGKHVPSGKANAGQKILFWAMVVVLGITLCVTGLILDFPNFNQTRADDAARQRGPHGRGPARASSCSRATSTSAPSAWPARSTR